jgi:cytochrome c551
MSARVIGITLCVIVGLSLNTGCGHNSTNLTTDAQGTYADAVRIYQNNCISCHGDALQGGMGPSLQHVAAKLTPGQIQHQIYTGGGPMPGYGQSQQGILSDKQIETITQWLSSKK